VISAIELLEHLADSDTLLAEIHRHLRPGGLFYLTTPNAASLNQRLLGPKWSVVSPPDHVTLWTIPGLRRALNRAGLRVERARTEGCNPAEIVVRARPAPPRVIDRTGAGVALSAALARHPGGRLVKTAMNAVLNFSRLGDTIKAWSVRDIRA
jgi:2-polyprenyl-3-methyl-5-hydroxy-6-metoxy-1,4-benzoquinol methylase